MDIEYFMDKLQPYEVNIIINNLNKTDKNLWEATRLIIYYNAMMWSKDKMELQDFMKFDWEKETGEIEREHNTEISNEDIKRLKERAKTISHNLGGNLNG